MSEKVFEEAQKSWVEDGEIRTQVLRLDDFEIDDSQSGVAAITEQNCAE